MTFFFTSNPCPSRLLTFNMAELNDTNNHHQSITLQMSTTTISKPWKCHMIQCIRNLSDASTILKEHQPPKSPKIIKVPNTTGTNHAEMKI
jgi:hypothetical protein